MAIYSYLNSGITFNNISEDGLKAFPQGHFNGNNNYAKANEEGIEPFVNAVEIDWNSAIIGEG